MSQSCVTDTGVTIAEKVLALRRALKLPQQTIADRAGWERNRITKLEQGKNQLTTRDAHSAIARGFQLTDAELDAYFSDAASLAATVELARLDRARHAESVRTENATLGDDRSWAAAVLEARQYALIHPWVLAYVARVPMWLPAGAVTGRMISDLANAIVRNTPGEVLLRLDPPMRHTQAATGAKR